MSPTRSRQFTFIFLCLFLVQCERDFSVPPVEEPARALTASEEMLVGSDNAFGLKLFGEISKSQLDKNVFISPLSVAMALGMTYNGAAGSTEEAMRNTLEFGEMSLQEINDSFKSLIELLEGLDSEVKFQIANSIWYRLGFEVEQDFIDLNQTYFDAEVRSLDFAAPTAPDVINDWVDRNTNGKIDKIIDSIDPLTMMFLINAIYFKGTWAYEFDEEQTADDLFTVPDGSQVDCRMMYQEGDFHYLATDEFQAVDLPYGNGKFSMAIFLPKPGVDVDDLIEECTPENWDLWTSSFAVSPGALYFPKLKLRYETSLKDVLIALGMEVAFTESADFTRINKNDDLFITDVIHKTFVQVDEEGTEAAAVTAVVVGTTSVDPTGFVMQVDRPFVFAIRENHSGTILFVGKVVEPTWQE